MVYRLEREDFLRRPYLYLWPMLAFQAGFINTFGFLACGRSVSHVTGFGTQIGLALANNKLLIAVDLIAFPGFFVFGSFLSALVTSARIERGQRPAYGKITLALPIILLVLLGLGLGGAFGPFGESFIYPRDFVLLFLLAIFCGMQNGCFATMTKGQIRTTHLTGVSTDLGTDAARILFGNLPRKEHLLTRRTQITRVLTVLGFASGSVLSIFTTPVFGYHVLILPFVTSIVTFLAAQTTSRFLDRRLLQTKRNRQERPHSAWVGNDGPLPGTPASVEAEHLGAVREPSPPTAHDILRPEA